MKKLFCLLALIALPALAAEKASAPAVLRVGTFNIRVPNDPPPNNWAMRFPRVKALLQKQPLDIIGMQEAADGGASGVLDWCPALNADLKDIYASRSLKDDTGLAHTICRGLIIFYKKSRFTLLDSGAAGYSQPANSKRCYQSENS